MNKAAGSGDPFRQQAHMSLAQAILAGQLLVNVPTLLLIFGAPLAGFVAARSFAPQLGLSWLCIVAGAALLVGCGIGWLWWSFAIPRWRRWALRRGVPPAELQKWGVLTFLVWPRGWIFEKTEFRLKE